MVRVRDERRFFREFCNEMKDTDLFARGFTPDVFFSPDTSALPINVLREYLRWRVIGTNGNIGGSLSLASAECYFDAFCIALKHYSGGQALDPDTRRSCLYFIGSDLKAEAKLVDQGLPRTWLIYDDVRFYLSNLFSASTQWASVKTTLSIVRRMTIAALFLYNIITSVRAGAILRPSKAKNMSKYGYLKVKDVSLLVTGSDDGERTAFASRSERSTGRLLTQSHRDPSNAVPGPPRKPGAVLTRPRARSWVHHRLLHRRARRPCVCRRTA